MVREVVTICPGATVIDASIEGASSGLPGVDADKHGILSEDDSRMREELSEGASLIRRSGELHPHPTINADHRQCRKFCCGSTGRP